MEKRAKLNEQVCCAHIRWISRSAKRVQWIPSAIKLPHIRGFSSDWSDDQNHQKLMVEPPTMVGLVFGQLLLMMSVTFLYLLRWS